jgi:hypothetical protein
MTQIVFLTSLLAVWQNPTPIYVGPGDQEIDVVISDGEGGAAVIWWDDVTEWNYMQVVDSAGNLKWDSEGVPIIANGSISTQNPDMFLDSLGNYWVALEGNEDIYVQKLSPTGQRLFGDDGVAVCAEEGAQQFPHLCSSGSGSIVIWADYRFHLDSNIVFTRAQRLNQDGIIQWPLEGVPISDSSHSFPDLVPDGNYGSLIAYTQFYIYGEGRVVFVQRLDSLGNRMWSEIGKSIHKGSFDSRMKCSLGRDAIEDGMNGIILFYTDSGLYMGQRIDSSGNLLWDTSGVCVGADNYSHFGSFSPLSSNGTYVVRGESHAEPHQAVYVHRVTLTGEIPWSDTGKVAWWVWGDDPQGFVGDIIPSVSDNGIIVWRDVGDHEGWYQQQGIMAQRIDTLGDTLWSGAVHICSTTGNEPSIISTNDKAGIVAWNDTRNGNTDVYTARIDSLGYISGIEEGKEPSIAALQLEVIGGTICSGSVELRFSLPACSKANLTVFDASGRKVRELTVQDNQRSIWDGYDLKGALCPQGVYFVRLEAESKSTGVKVVLLK